MPSHLKFTATTEQPDYTELEHAARARLAAAAVILRRLREPLLKVCGDLDAMTSEFSKVDVSERVELMGEGLIPSSFWWNAARAANLEKSEGSPLEFVDQAVADLERAATITDAELVAEFEAEKLAQWRKTGRGAQKVVARG